MARTARSSRFGWAKCRHGDRDSSASFWAFPAGGTGSPLSRTHGQILWPYKAVSTGSRGAKKFKRTFRLRVWCRSAAPVGAANSFARASTRIFDTDEDVLAEVEQTRLQQVQGQFVAGLNGVVGTAGMLPFDEVQRAKQIVPFFIGRA
jgi:hypothetical protein